MADNLSTILIDAKPQIDSVCEAFERAFQKHPRPNVESFLQGEGPARWQMLLALVNSELELRLRQGEAARLKEYIERYPELLHFPNELSALLLTEVKLLGKRQALVLEDYQKTYPQLNVREIFRQIGAAPPEVSGYEILNQIGQGGMGVVYRARQILLNRDVAVKLIRKDRLLGVEANQSFQIRFQREAKAIAAINHPNVIQIFEAGNQDGDLFIAMEFVNGPSLQARLQADGIFEFAKAAKLVAKAADAIQTVHDRGIIHRDIKPDNILLTPHGEPKITDFGLARPAELPDSRTHAGCFIGTPEYSSPEQARMTGEAPTPAVDVYGLGAVLYACLTGVPPFSRETLEITLEKVRSQPVLPVRELRPQCPKDLETICLKCLQKDPQNRYATALELSNDLNRFLGGKPVLARPIPKTIIFWKFVKRNSLISSVAFTSALLLLAAAILSMLMADAATQEAARALAAEHRSSLSESEARKSAEELKQANFKIKELYNRATIHLASEQLNTGSLGNANRRLLEIPAEERTFEWGLLRSVLTPSISSDSLKLGGKRCLAVAPDSDRIAMVASDSPGSAADSLEIWDIAKCQRLFTLLHPNEKNFSCAAFAADGKTLVAGMTTVTLPFSTQQMEVN